MANRKAVPVAAIVGPTAVGKTALSLTLAGRLGAEIISVDSRQVYRYLDVGSDKASHEIRKEIPHHMIDVADPDEVFSAAEFVERARSAVYRIMNRGRVPLFVGGTPFYCEALFKGMLSDGAPRDEGLRRELEEFAAGEGREALFRRLAAVDPESAGRLHVNDVRRVVRALEIHTLTGMAQSEWFRGREKMSGREEFDVLYIGLNRERKLLFKAIERRVGEQFSGGFPEEVKWLLDQGYDERFPSMQGFGYRELVEHFRGKITLEEAAERDISYTKAFSRRQMTWFGKFEPIVWYDTSDGSLGELSDQVEKEVRAHLGKS
ncbi:MAG: tRNA (adenosine(37)-N6)-dimethylallyltransferase MiaA [Aminivibrio sp.]|jgi:tRNA dimethylallyltransferase